MTTVSASAWPFTPKALAEGRVGSLMIRPARATVPRGRRDGVNGDAMRYRSSRGRDTTYGMGLMVDTKYETPFVHPGGDRVGYHSDMTWLPEHNVGAVILTNADPGWSLRGPFGRQLLDVLFDGRPEADADVAAQAKSYFEQLAAERTLMTIPADAAVGGTLAARYTNPVRGDITVHRSGGSTVFDGGEWKGEVASRRNPDGTVSFLTIAPGIIGFEFVVGSGPTPTLIVRDAQHEYVFTTEGAGQSSR